MHGTAAAPSPRESNRAPLRPTGRGQKRDTDVIDKLGFLFRFWELKARHATLGQPLGSHEQLELLSLMQLVTSELRVPEPGSCARPANALPAQLIGEGAIVGIEIRHVCAAALLVASAQSMSPGERVIVRAADAVSGVELSLPCSVSWVHAGSPFVMALVVDGIPTREDLTLGTRSTNVLSIARPIRLVG